VLSVESLSVAPEQGAGLVAGALAAVSFEVAGGEIYGIAGVEGNGQRELELALAGVIAPVAGSIRVLGAPIAEQRTRVAYIPSDGQQWGIVRDLSVAENLLLREIAAGPALAIAATRRPGAGVTVERDIARFNVVPPNPSLLAKRLSGGNAQKLLLARELGRAPALIVAAQPTIGLDVASAAFVRAALRRAAEEGAAVLVISSDLDELFELANRIGVMYHGAMQGEWEAAAASLVALGAAMAGMTVRQPSASG
jgi:simple sugar transport system ATP-binding protein